MVPIWLMIFSLEHCHSDGVFVVAKLKKKRQAKPNPNDYWEPCHLVPIWLMIFSLEHCHSGGVFVVAKLKKKDRLNLTLTIYWEPCHLGSNMVNDFSFGALSHWRCVCGSQKKRQAKHG